MNKKISALTALGGTPNTADIIPITDVSDTTGSAQGTTKKVTVANLIAAAPQGDLLASNNLSDVGSAGTSRTNLGLGTAAVANTGTSSGNVVVLDATGLPAVDGSQLTGISSAVDGTAVTSTGETGATKFLREDGDGTCSFQTVSAAVTASDLRGTTNPHIGAFPNQSFLVVDNPSKSVMLGSDADGKIYVFNSSGKTAISTGISAVEDSTEPDIEITTTTGTYSLITGDSDAKDPNGLPVQQGFNAPDIGAFSSPLLISGGSIA